MILDRTHQYFPVLSITPYHSDPSFCIVQWSDWVWELGSAWDRKLANMVEIMKQQGEQPKEDYCEMRGEIPIRVVKWNDSLVNIEGITDMEIVYSS